MHMSNHLKLCIFINKDIKTYHLVRDWQTQNHVMEVMPFLLQLSCKHTNTHPHTGISTDVFKKLTSAGRSKSVLPKSCFQVCPLLSLAQMTCKPTTTLVLLPTLLCPGSSKLALPLMRITGLAAVCCPKKEEGVFTQREAMLISQFKQSLQDL